MTTALWALAGVVALAGFLGLMRVAENLLWRGYCRMALAANFGAAVLAWSAIILGYLGVTAP